MNIKQDMNFDMILLFSISFIFFISISDLNKKKVSGNQKPFFELHWIRTSDPRLKSFKRVAHKNNSAYRLRNKYLYLNVLFTLSQTEWF